jgi:hypothetical protein
VVANRLRLERRQSVGREIAVAHGAPAFRGRAPLSKRSSIVIDANVASSCSRSRERFVAAI